MKKVIDEAVYSKAWEGFKGKAWKRLYDLFRM